MNILLATQLAERGPIEQANFDSDYRRWETQSQIIAGRVQAYFSGTSIPSEYAKLVEVVTDVYVLSGARNPHREGQIKKLANNLPDSDLNWSALQNLNLKGEKFMEWFEQWWKLREATIKLKDDLVQKLLMAKLTLGG